MSTPFVKCCLILKMYKCKGKHIFCVVVMTFICIMQDIMSMKTVGPHLQQLQGLLKDAILRVCENKAPFLKKLKIEGTVCVTTDLEGVVVTQITETIVQSERRRDLSPESSSSRRWHSSLSPHQMAPPSPVPSHTSGSSSPRPYPVKIFNRDSLPPKRRIKSDSHVIEVKPEISDSSDCVVIIPEDPADYSQDKNYSWHQPVPRNSSGVVTNQAPESGIDYSSPKKVNIISTSAAEPPAKLAKVSFLNCHKMAPMVATGVSWEAGQGQIVIGQIKPREASASSDVLAKQNHSSSNSSDNAGMVEF